MNTRVKNIRQKCWDKAFEAFGTGFIFEERARKLRSQLRALTFLGIVVPLIAGVIVLAFGKVAIAPVLLIPAAILGAIQVVGSLWSLVAGWDDSYSYAIESLSSNYRLSNIYQKLAENPPSKIMDLEAQFNLVEREDEMRRSEDNKHVVTEKEKRKGMRAALRQFRRACAGCGQVPTSMKASDCPVCGQF